MGSPVIKMGSDRVVSDAALAASVFHYGEIEISELKKELAKQGLNMRI